MQNKLPPLILWLIGLGICLFVGSSCSFSPSSTPSEKVKRHSQFHSFQAGEVRLPELKALSRGILDKAYPPLPSTPFLIVSASQHHVAVNNTLIATLKNGSISRKLLQDQKAHSYLIVPLLRKLQQLNHQRSQSQKASLVRKKTPLLPVVLVLGKQTPWHMLGRIQYTVAQSGPSAVWFAVCIRSKDSEPCEFRRLGHNMPTFTGGTPLLSKDTNFKVLSKILETTKLSHLDRVLGEDKSSDEKEGRGLFSLVETNPPTKPAFTFPKQPKWVDFRPGLRAKRQHLLLEVGHQRGYSFRTHQYISRGCRLEKQPAYERTLPTVKGINNLAAVGACFHRLKSASPKTHNIILCADDANTPWQNLLRVIAQSRLQKGQILFSGFHLTTCCF